MTITTTMIIIVDVLIEEDEDLEEKSSIFILHALFLNKMFSSVFNHIVSPTAVYMSLGIPPQLDELPPIHPPFHPPHFGSMQDLRVLKRTGRRVVPHLGALSH